MNREEFLRQLEQLLTGISEEEKADALAFYRSYFEDAGEENEASVIAELESPQKVAESIRKNLGLDKNGGYYNTYANRDAEYYKNVNRTIQNLSGQNREPKNNWSALTITVLVLTSPVWLTLLLVLLSVLLAVVAVLFAVAIAALAVMAALVVTGFVLIGCGFASIPSGGAAIGIGLIGSGLLVLALGVLAVLLVVWVFGAFLPWAFRGIAKLCRRLVRRGKESAAA